jgi:hypothetical protein
MSRSPPLPAIERLLPVSHAAWSGRVDFAVLSYPFNIAALGMQLDLTEQLDRLGFKTGFPGIGIRDDRFYFDDNNVVIGSQQSGSIDSLAWQCHGFTLATGTAPRFAYAARRGACDRPL